jgi:hypothetical protein
MPVFIIKFVRDELTILTSSNLVLLAWSLRILYSVAGTIASEFLILVHPTNRTIKNYDSVTTRGRGLRDKDPSSNYLPWRIPMIDDFNKMVVERVQVDRFGI